MTKDILTDYAEGIACNNFDIRHNYHVRRIATNTWFVLSKKTGNIQKLDNKQVKSYDRVRKVLIDYEGLNF